MLAGIVLLTSWTVHGSGACTVITLYSQKDWVSAYDFFDMEFQASETTLINSRQIVAQLNALGSLSAPRGADSRTLAGFQPLTVKGKQNPKDPMMFSIRFGKPLRRVKFSLQLDARDEQGQPLEKTVWINGDMQWVDGRGEMVSGTRLITTDQSEITLDLKDQQISSLTVLFERNDDQCSYTLNYFQISEYEVQEHIRWVREPIAEADTRQLTVCLDQGEFEPQSTGNLWKREQTVVFTPSVSLFAEQNGTSGIQHDVYDVGRGDNIAAYSDPEVVKTLDQYAARIHSWQKEIRADGHRYRFLSLSQRGLSWPWITTQPGQGVRYLVLPVYWTQQANLPDTLWQSEDADWCRHTTGNSKTPCYKIAGHSSNSRLNAYDVQVMTYQDLYDPQGRSVVMADYTLVNPDEGVRRKLTAEDNQSLIAGLDTSGRWQIEADLIDDLGNRLTVRSGIYLIDNTSPEIHFFPVAKQKWSNQAVEVRIRAQDAHSGVRRIRWAVSRDGGEHFSEPGAWFDQDSAVVKLDDGGQHVIRVESEDQAGNRSVAVSDVYRLDFQAPQARQSGLQQEGRVLDLASDRWLTQREGLILFAEGVQDRPEIHASGVGQVWVQLQEQKKPMTDQGEGRWQTEISSLVAEGSQQAEIFGCDEAGNCALMQTLGWKADFHGPQISARLQPEDWTNKTVTVQLQATDEVSGVEFIQTPQGKTKGDQASFTVTENGQVQVSATDRAGHTTTRNVTVTNIDKIPPQAVFTPDQGRADKQITVTVAPSDELSGIRRWRYQLTYDQGETILSTSPWFEDDQPQDVTLSLSGQGMILVEAWDRAGNMATIRSGLYVVNQGDSAVASLFAPVSAIAEPARLQAQIRCEHCDPTQKQQVQVYQDDELIYEEEIPALPQQSLFVSYTLQKPQARLRLKTTYALDEKQENNELTLQVHSLSAQSVQTEKEELTLQGDVMFSIRETEEQKTYQETLTLISPRQQESLFAGQGIEAEVQVRYENECARIRQWACEASAHLELTGSAEALFDQGALPVREKYARDSIYAVAMTWQSDRAVLPQMWATLHEGLINDQPVFENLEPTDQILDAGRRWYTDPLAAPQTLSYVLQGSETGVNRFHWQFLRTATISQTMRQQYRLRFVNPQDPDTLAGRLWQPYVSWFASLKGKEPMASVVSGEK